MGLICVLLLTAVLQVRITTIDGVSRDASLTAVTERGIEIESGGKVEKLALDKLLSVERLDRPATTTPAMRVELFDGTRVAVTGITASEASATLSIRGQEPLLLPLTRVRWVRFRQGSPAVDPQWLGMIEKSKTADVLVVRRANDAVDEVQGIVKSISSEFVNVDLDGDSLQAPIGKLEGVMFADREPLADAGKIIVDDLQGSRWRAISLAASAPNIVSIDLGDGLTHQLPLDQLSRIETTGSVLYLATELPVESNYTPGSKLGLDGALANQWFGAKTGDDRDLVMRADSHVEFRIDKSFATLAGSAQFDPSVAAGGKCLLRILLDDKVVWEQTFDVSESSPRGYELPIGAARRLRFEVRTAGDGDLGDTLRIRQPRLVK